MCKWILGLLCAMGVLSGSENQVAKDVKPKILVLSCKGGYGHVASAHTLENLLGDVYDVQIVYPMDEMLDASGVDLRGFYDVMLKNRWIRSMNFLVRRVAPRFFRMKQRSIESIVASYILQQQSNLVISVIPFVNYPASEAARKQQVPYLLVTTDNDLRNWVYGLERIKHPQFVVTIGADLPTTRNVLLQKKIPATSIETIGLPLRQEFINYQAREGMKEAYGIPSAKPVVLVMMGGSGSRSAYDYAKKVGQLPYNVHLIVCTGRHEKLKRDLNKLRLDPSNSMTVIGFTDRVADFMALADVMITKPGPGTINEAIAMRLPVLVDSTEISLFWERANARMVSAFGIGESVTRLKDVGPALDRFLYDELHTARVEQAFEMLPANRFHEGIRSIVARLTKGSAGNNFPIQNCAEASVVARS